MVSSLQASPSPKILPLIDILIHLLAERAQIELLYFHKPLGVNCASQRVRLIGCGSVVRSS